MKNAKTLKNDSSSLKRAASTIRNELAADGHRSTDEKRLSKGDTDLLIKAVVILDKIGAKISVEAANKKRDEQMKEAAAKKGRIEATKLIGSWPQTTVRDKIKIVLAERYIQWGARDIEEMTDRSLDTCVVGKREINDDFNRLVEYAKQDLIGHIGYRIGYQGKTITEVADAFNTKFNEPLLAGVIDRLTKKHESQLS